MWRLACIAAFLSVFPVAAQDEPEQETVAAGSYETLEPRLRRIFFQRAGDFIRTPDGRIWDGWGQRAYREAFQKNTVIISEGVSESAGVFRVRRETGRRLDIRDAPEAKAWKLQPRLKAQSPILVPFWFTLERKQHEPRPPFYYINQQPAPDELDPIRDRFTRVEAELGGGYLRVKIYPAGQQRGSPLTRIVLAPEDLVIENAQLPGEFILWRARAVKPPAHIRLPKNQSVYRYLPLEEIRLTPEDLVVVAVEGKAEVAEWDYRRSGEDYVWRRSVVAPQFRELDTARAAEKAAPDGETDPSVAPKQPPPEPTQILHLRDGRSLRGRLISREAGQVVFAVQAGGAEFEARFEAADVKTIDPVE